MINRYLTTDAFREFNKLALHVQRWIVTTLFELTGENDLVLQQRFIQRFYELGLIPFIQHINARINDNLLPFDIQSITLVINKLKVNTHSGEISLTFNGLIVAVAEFFAHWLLTLKSILLGIAKVSTISSATLVYGVGNESLVINATDKRFIDFCEKGKIDPLKDAQNLLIQSSIYTGFISNRRFSYTKYPHLGLLERAKLGFRNRCLLLINHLFLPLKFIFKLIKFPVSGVLAKDFALSIAMNFLDKKGFIESVVITNSNGKAQPLWMRGERQFQVHMVWYSQNTRIHCYHGSEVVEKSMPHIKHISADIHWVWTESYKAYLLETLIMPSVIHVVGPILWYLDNSKVNNLKGIAVFDVIPIVEDAWPKFGMLDNYYSAENAIKFMADLLDTLEEVNTQIRTEYKLFLKHKRDAGHVLYSRDYLDYIDDLVSQKKICLFDYQINIYEMVGNCELTIAMPYTSPVYVATEQKKPAIYFDATEQLLPSYDASTYLYFASGKTALKTLLMQHLIS